MADDVRILPTEWVGTWAGASWGVVTAHNPKYSSHSHLDPEWHAVGGEVTLQVLRQEERSLELLVITPGHESKAVGALSSDGRRLVVSTRELTYHLTVNGNSMEGELFGRPHGSERSSDSFAAHVIELTAKS